MPHRLRGSGRVCRIDCGDLAVYGTWIVEFRPYNRMDCGTPQRVGSHWNVRKPQRGARPRPSAHPWAFFYIVQRLWNAERY